MKGRTEEEIKASIQKMKKIAEIYEGEKLEITDSYIEDNVPKDNNQSIWFLSKSLEKLASADVFIGISDSWDWNGCYVEQEVAHRYRIKSYSVNPRFIIDNYDALVRSLRPINETVAVNC